MKYLQLILLIAIAVACSNEDKPVAYGNFEAIEVLISAKGGGEITKINLNEGDKLPKDEVVCVIDTTGLVLQKENLKTQIELTASQYSDVNAQLQIVETNRSYLQSEKTRVTKLFNDGAATKKQLDEITNRCNVIDKELIALKVKRSTISNQIKVVRSNIDIINQKISDCIIENPLSGIVLEKYVEEFELVAVGKPLYKIADLSEMTLKAYVSGDQLPYVKIGDNVTISIDRSKTENTSYKGVVSWISSESEFTPKTIQTKEERVNLVYAVKILVKNDGKIKIGMPGQVESF